jgi:hypothetical protein
MLSLKFISLSLHKKWDFQPISMNVSNLIKLTYEIEENGITVSNLIKLTYEIEEKGIIVIFLYK